MKMATKASSKRGSVIRVATLQNPKTKRQLFVRVTKDGKLGKRDAQHLGVKQVAAWVEVPAKSWAQATKLVRAGKGKRVTRTAAAKAAKAQAPKEEIRKAA